MRRLFPTFVHGGPGLGLLLLRLGAGALLVAHSSTVVSTVATGSAIFTTVLTVLIGLLVIVGLWTPITGWLLAIAGIWDAVAHHTGHPFFGLLMATIGAALALSGPGAYSIDARLFGWKRIELRDRSR